MNATIRTPYLDFRKHAIRHIFVEPLGKDNLLAQVIASLHSFAHVFTSKVGMPPSKYRAQFTSSASHPA